MSGFAYLFAAALFMIGISIQAAGLRKDVAMQFVGNGIGFAAGWTLKKR